MLKARSKYLQLNTSTTQREALNTSTRSTQPTMHLLLTGATGFLGSHLLRHWVGQGHTVAVLKRSASSLHRVADCAQKCHWYDVDQPNWERLFADHPIEAVVHVAASYGRKGEGLADIFEANTAMPVRLLEQAIKHKVRLFLNTASSLPRDLNAYALSKAQFADWLQFHRNGIHTAHLVLEYFYGAGDDDWKFISMVMQKLLREEPFIDFTEGLQKRDFIYIADVVTAFDAVLHHAAQLDSGSLIPVGSGESHSLRSVVELCKNIFQNTKTKLNFGAIPGRPGEAPDLKADTSLLRSLRWQPRYSLEEGLMRMKGDEGG